MTAANTNTTDLTDTEIDAVAGGQQTQFGLINVGVSDVNVAAPITAQAAVNALGIQGVAQGITNPGNVNQRA